MKDYIRENLSLSFGDERIQLAFNMAYTIPRVRKDMTNIISILPNECLDAMVQGRDYSDKSCYVRHIFGAKYNERCLKIFTYNEANKLGLTINYGEFYNEATNKDLVEKFVATTKGFKDMEETIDYYLDEYNIRVERGTYLGDKIESTMKYNKVLENAIANDISRLSPRSQYVVIDDIHKCILEKVQKDNEPKEKTKRTKKENEQSSKDTIEM